MASTETLTYSMTSEQLADAIATAMENYKQALPGRHQDLWFEHLQKLTDEQLRRSRIAYLGSVVES